MADAKQPIDWAEIERDYCSSPMPVREMARWYGISEAAIRKKAKASSWVRANPPESAQPKAANPEPEIEIVRTPLTSENISPEAIVSRGRNLVLRMMDELEAVTVREGEMDAMISVAVDTGDGGEAMKAIKQAVSLKTRSDVLKSLTLAAKTLAESGAPAGVKAQRQKAGEAVSKGGGKYAAPPAPKLVVNNAG